MQDASLRESIRRKYLALAEDLDERGRRRWAATEARDLGWGGITLVAAATGLSDRTIRNGLEELDAPQPLRSHRQRREGGGRKPHRETQPKLLDALDRLIEPTARGAPTHALRWTCQSTRRLARRLRDLGFRTSATAVRRMLAGLGYSLRANRKTREGRQHPDRDGQFPITSRFTVGDGLQSGPDLPLKRSSRRLEWQVKGGQFVLVNAIQ